MACGQAKSEIDQAREDVQQTARDVTAAAAGVKAAADVITDRTARAAPPKVTDDYVKSSATTLCKAENPADFAIQAACKRNAENGAASLTALMQQYNDVPEMQAALAKCVGDHTKGGATDFAMAGACARNNDQGFKEMARDASANLGDVAKRANTK